MVNIQDVLKCCGLQLSDDTANSIFWGILGAKEHFVQWWWNFFDQIYSFFDLNNKFWRKENICKNKFLVPIYWGRWQMCKEKIHFFFFFNYTLLIFQKCVKMLNIKNLKTSRWALLKNAWRDVFRFLILCSFQLLLKKIKKA